MAEALSSILGEKIKDAIETGVRLVMGADDDLEWLSSTFKAIQSLLGDADARQFQEESLRDWIAKLKDVAYDLDDILDEWRTLQLTAEINASGDDGGGFVERVRNNNPLLNFSHYKTRLHMASRVREVRERLDVINGEKDHYQLVPSGKVERDDLNFEYRKTSCFIDESEVIGRNDEKDAIINRLTSESRSRENGICVISVVGMGGLGKTTLAQLVYNDYRVKNHFKKRIWVCVSDDFNVTNLTKKILEDVIGSAANLTELNTIQNKLVENLGNEPFLLVLDDVWNEERSKWEALMVPLKCSGMHGSKVLMTTRSEKVASEADASHIHRPKCLSEEDSWSLFSRRAFFGREKEECLELQDIGSEIVKKCRGIPLSLKTLGSVMQRKRTAEDWKHVLKSEMWVSLQQGGKGIIPALLLSYDNLPMHLKQCFAYCAIFPKDYGIERDVLIKLWMAQGFIRYEEGRQMEEIGSDYLDDLLCYSLFQVASEGDRSIYYKMHDLIHDLAQFVTKNECYVAVNSEADVIPDKCRHLSLIGFKSLQSFSLGNLRYLRTIICLGRAFHFPRPSSIDIISLDLPICLRALDLHYYEAENLPNSIGNLKHLRYLNLCYARIKELPESVCNLCNLQTLGLKGCKEFEYLPNSIGNLKHLRYLNLSWTMIKELHESVCNICNLQTLDLNHCKGFEYLPNSIGNLKHLRYLNLSWTMIEDLPESVCILCNLQTLDLNGCLGFEYLPNSIGNLKHLRYLNLSWTRIKELPESVCNLCNLQTLDLNQCGLLSKLPIGLSKLVNLRHLTLESIDNLVNIPKGIERLTALQELSKFIVGGEGGCKIGELGDLNLLRGYLEIQNLERVIDGNEAAEAKLDKKQHLESLVLSCKSMDEDELGMLDEVETKRFNEILESLRPPNAELDVLQIVYYFGSMFPKWIDESSLFSKLTHIELSHCRKCRKLPTLGTLPSLESLCIKYNDEVESVGFEFTGNGPIVFPKLKTLVFKRMYKWKEWELGVRDGRVFMPCLLDLKVLHCPQLTLELRRLAMPRLKKLRISNIGALHESKLPLLSNLEELVISKVANLTSLPKDGWERLQSLSTLTINSCPQLTSLPDGLQQLKFPKRLIIHNCPQLTYLPDGLQQLTTLGRLEITACPYLTESCKKDVGHDWFKIAHIEYLYIDDGHI